MDLRKDTEEQSQSNWTIWISLFQTWKRQVPNEKMTCQQVIQDIGAKKLGAEISSSQSLRKAFCFIFRKSGNPISPRNSIQNADLCVAISLGSIFLFRYSLRLWKSPGKSPVQFPSENSARGSHCSKQGCRNPKNMKWGWIEEVAPLKYQNVFFHRLDKYPWTWRWCSQEKTVFFPVQ